MMDRPTDHPATPEPKIGVLLTNLGTPDAADAPAVRRYLAEFLSDRRVIEIPRVIWKPILHGIILRTRPKKSAHAYKQVWTDAGSPLAAITQAQTAALQSRLGSAAVVDFAMRYGNPGIARVVAKLVGEGCTRLLIAPLYPQYSGATTATVVDAVGSALAKMRWQPTLRYLPPYYDDPTYIAALKSSIEGQLQRLDFRPDRLLISFHGMPERTLKLGDPYHCHCQKTGRLLGEALALPVEVSFQSRFGRAKWLEPSTEDRLTRLPAEGVKRLAIAAPGFSVDCLETIEELGIRGKETFLQAGGTHFARLECLNSGADGMDMLEQLVRRELEGWIDRA